MFNRFNFATPSFAPNSVWGKWLRANRQVLACVWAVGLLALTTTIGQVHQYYFFQKTISAWQWLYLPIFILGVVWYIVRQKAWHIYDTFSQEVEARKKDQQNINLSPVKQQVIRQFHTLTSWNMWKGIATLLFGSWAITYTHQTFSKMNLKEPVRFSIQIRQGITRQQDQIKVLVTNYCEMHTSLRHHQARATALKRMVFETKKSLQLQSYSLYEGYNARAQLNQAQHQLRVATQISPAQQIRNNPSVFQIIKGQTEVYLFLQNKEAQASEGILAQDDHLLSGFQDVQIRYDQHLNIAQKSIYRDQNKLQELDKELADEQRIVERLMVALADNQKLRAKFIKHIQRDFGYWFQRKRHEQRLDSIQKR